MNREIWEFLVSGSHRVIRTWFEEENVSPEDRAKLDVKLNQLRTLDFGLVSKKLLAGPLKGTKVYKLRIRCRNRELRPILCRGPVGPILDYTLLHGALEIGDRLRPSDAADRADANRRILIDSPGWREVY
jgi:hypothetical protein